MPGAKHDTMHPCAGAMLIAQDGAILAVCEYFGDRPRCGPAAPKII